MTLRVIPILALLGLFISGPVLACEAMARDARSSAAPMDMARGCADDAAGSGATVLCPATAMIAPTPHVEMPGNLVAIVSKPLAYQACRSGSGFPLRPDSAPSPPSKAPLYKLHTIYLI